MYTSWTFLLCHQLSRAQFCTCDSLNDSSLNWKHKSPDARKQEPLCKEVIGGTLEGYSRAQTEHDFSKERKRLCNDDYMNNCGSEVTT